MSEGMFETIEIPEKCSNCPIAEKMHEKFQIESERLAKLASAAITSNSRTTRGVAVKRTAADQVQAQEFEQALASYSRAVSESQAIIDQLSGDCIHPVIETLALPLGNTAIVRVCGSAAPFLETLPEYDVASVTRVAQ